MAGTNSPDMFDRPPRRVRGPRRQKSELESRREDFLEAWASSERERLSMLTDLNEVIKAALAEHGIEMEESEGE
jgi:hypothetical protein